MIAFEEIGNNRDEQKSQRAAPGVTAVCEELLPLGLFHVGCIPANVIFETVYANCF